MFTSRQSTDQLEVSDIFMSEINIKLKEPSLYTIGY